MRKSIAVAAAFILAAPAALAAPRHGKHAPAHRQAKPYDYQHDARAIKKDMLGCFNNLNNSHGIRGRLPGGLGDNDGPIDVEEGESGSVACKRLTSNHITSCTYQTGGTNISVVFRIDSRELAKPELKYSAPMLAGRITYSAMAMNSVDTTQWPMLTLSYAAGDPANMKPEAIKLENLAPAQRDLLYERLQMGMKWMSACTAIPT